MTVIDSEGAVKLHRVQAGAGQFYLLAAVTNATPPEAASSAAYRMLAAQLARDRAEIVHERIFGNLAVAPIALASRERALDSICETRVLPTFVEGAPLWGPGLAGVVVRAVQPASTKGIEILHDGSKPIGHRWLRDGLQQWLLQGVTGAKGDDSVADDLETELHCLFERISRVLETHGASFADVTRTWFYLDRIVPNYATFNRVRNHHYQLHGLEVAAGSTRHLPASTGIGGRTLGKSKVIVDVLATQSTRRGVTERLASSTQQEPVHYGSSFSRAAIVHEADCDLIQLSGTAAIGAAGESLHPNDACAQIDSTVAHVRTLLLPKRAQLHDVVSATLFLKLPEHATLLAERLRAHGLDDLPLVAVVADVCRDELLFEMDAELVVAAR